MEHKHRIEYLRQKALSPIVSFDEVYLDFLIRYEQNTALDSLEARYADAYTYALEHLSPSIDECELIVGKPCHPVREERVSEWERLAYLRDELSAPGMDSHMAIDYELLLSKGTSGVIERINEYMRETDDPKKLHFYTLARACLCAVNTCADNYANHAERLASECTNVERKTELLQIAEACRNVPRNPARSFYEAIQSVSFFTYLVTFQPLLYRTQQFQLGRPDRYLYSYYKNDIENGKITRDEAQLLLDCLAIQINHRVPSGLSSGYMVGGRDKNGCVVQNELTAMCMQVIDDVRLVYPSVGLCMTRDTDDSYLRLACEILSHGRSHPAIFNDELISEGLNLYGVPPELASDYIHSTCVEITPIAASSAWVASPYTNLPQLLLDILAKDFPSFDALLAEYFEKLGEQIATNYQIQLSRMEIRRQKTLSPLLSCFVNDCLKKGCDIEQDGARYRWIMPSFVGVSNLVDCLYVLKKHIFESKRFTLADVRMMIEENFDGYEKERLLFLEQTDKYGNEAVEIDELVSLVTQKIVAFCKKHSETFGDADMTNQLVPSVFCWIMHERFGRATGATPDGRRAGFPLGDGSGPCQGRERNGVLASILSSTSWSHKEMIGGVAVNVKFSKRIFDSNSLKNVMALIKTYLERGGFELQVNVVDRETLLEAQRCPEAYADLVVRIGGYSDYFVRLSPEMQAEILLRTSHEV